MALALLGCVVKIDRKASSSTMLHATYVRSCDQTDKVVIVASVHRDPEQSIYAVLTACHKLILVLF